jgi:hypothetical protein
VKKLKDVVVWLGLQEWLLGLLEFAFLTALHFTDIGTGHNQEQLN